MQDVFDSVFSSVDAIVFRCKNDSDYTIEDIRGSVDSILGYAPEDIVDNAVVSWVGLTAKEDEERLLIEVNSAINDGKPWDVAYRMQHANGHLIWVRTRGAAKYVDGKLVCLEGLVVSADAELKLRGEVEKVLNDAQSANGEIVDLTRKITGSIRQLTMLAVNARIEAARLGDEGRGFTIVAEEMKRLAEQNAQWASVITDKMSEQAASG